ncbi:hypothetical protein IWZ01DRAFT_478662 [Phyllosticta capitalensis]
MAKLSSHFKQALGTFESHSTSHSTKCLFAKAPFWSSWQRSAATTHQRELDFSIDRHRLKSLVARSNRSQNAEGDHGMDVGIGKSMERRHGYAEAHFRWENSHPTQEASIPPRSERTSSQATEQSNSVPGSTSTVVLVVLLTDTAAAWLTTIRESSTSQSTATDLSRSLQRAVESQNAEGDHGMDVGIDTQIERPWRRKTPASNPEPEPTSTSDIPPLADDTDAGTTRVGARSTNMRRAAFEKKSCMRWLAWALESPPQLSSSKLGDL